MRSLLATVFGRGARSRRRPRSSLALVAALALGLVALLGFGVGVARAQDESEAPTERVHTRVVRPPEGSLRRGPWPVPGWVPYAGGGLVLAAAAGALAYRARKSRR